MNTDSELDFSEDSLSAASGAAAQKKKDKPNRPKAQPSAAETSNEMSNQPIKDEFSVFGEFVASELRSIPMDRARYIQRKLNRNLLDLMDEVELVPPSRQELNKLDDSVVDK